MKLLEITPQLSEDEIGDCPRKKNIIAGLISLSVYEFIYLNLVIPPNWIHGQTEYTLRERARERTEETRENTEIGMQKLGISPPLTRQQRKFSNEKFQLFCYSCLSPHPNCEKSLQKFDRRELPREEGTPVNEGVNKCKMKGERGKNGRNADGGRPAPPHLLPLEL